MFLFLLLLQKYSNFISISLRLLFPVIISNSPPQLISSFSPLSLGYACCHFLLAFHVFLSFFLLFLISIPTLIYSTISKRKPLHFIEREDYFSKCVDESLVKQNCIFIIFPCFNQWFWYSIDIITII